MSTVIIDYGVGNLFSLCCSFRAIGEEAAVSGDPEVIRAAERIILPGVGAFADAAEKLRAGGLDTVLKERKEAGIPIMGICLGMQLLFEKSFEYGEHPGLGFLRGEVRPISEVIDPELKIPHMGWNALRFSSPKHPLFKYLHPGDCVYFVHSYSARNCADSVIATAEYGADLTAAVALGNVMGCQFHPEKSGAVGLSILRAFCEIRRGDL